MSEIELAIKALSGYGALGGVCVYFMIKDWKMTTKINDTLGSIDKSFSILVNVLGGGKIDIQKD